MLSSNINTDEGQKKIQGNIQKTIQELEFHPRKHPFAKERENGFKKIKKTTPGKCKKQGQGS